jgi:hypothetical protein
LGSFGNFFSAVVLRGPKQVGSISRERRRIKRVPVRELITHAGRSCAMRRGIAHDDFSNSQNAHEKNASFIEAKSGFS